MAELMMEPLWWADPDAAEERRALIAAFQVEDLEEAAADLRERCERLERRRCCGQVVTVGEVAEVLLGQWSVAFHTRLADSQRAFFCSGDHDRSERAAQDGRAAAVAVRDRYLTPKRISGHSLRQALSLANADASGLRLARSDARRLRPQRSEAARTAPAADRMTDLINRLRADDRKAARSRDRTNGRGMSM
ncbi:MAG: hypothetical protein ACRD0K_01770 [Egibacteraceae bacterium]